ncbi:MAG TPA: hypothetical protein P5521_01355 [Candidatus Omnitrophota bacterium]|nr:hypothetical protein [Candidatus Omnitrophota bacterium]
MAKTAPLESIKVKNEVADKVLLVLNSYDKLEFSLDLKQLFKKKLRERYNKTIDVELVGMAELGQTRGNLTGYLKTHERIKKLLSKKKLDSFDTIVYIHDAGLATRIFPLSYEFGTPSKASIRFPEGRAPDMLLPCIAKSIPLLKNTVIILPIDQCFDYADVDINGLLRSLNSHSTSMLLTPIQISRALGSLGTAKIDEDNRISSFYEKTFDEKLIPKYSKGMTLANTFQLFTTKDNLDKIQSAVDLFCSKEKNKDFISHLNATEWSFNKLICESLVLEKKALSKIQLAMRECLQQYEISVGGAIAKGYWIDWASNIMTYLELLRKLTAQISKPDENGNYFVRSKKIKPSSKLESCVFIDCDTVDLFGSYKNCIFIACEWVRIMNCFEGSGSLFYALKKKNFLRKEMNYKLFAHFLSGRRNIEFECDIYDDYRNLYSAMKKVSDDWLYYHEVLKESYNTK